MSDLLAFVTMHVNTRTADTNKSEKIRTLLKLVRSSDQDGCEILPVFSFCVIILNNPPWNHAW